MKKILFLVTLFVAISAVSSNYVSADQGKFDIDIDPFNYDFGTVYDNSSDVVSKVITITNNESEAVLIAPISTSDFDVFIEMDAGSNPCGDNPSDGLYYQIDPNESCTASINIIPSNIFSFYLDDNGKFVSTVTFSSKIKYDLDTSEPSIDVVAQFVTPADSVYRFWSDTYKGHFYTIDEAERDYIITYDSNWNYEGRMWGAYKNKLDVSGGDSLSPVYRFWSEQYKHHFYTISNAEKTYVLDNLDDVWEYEGTAYYAWAQAKEGTRPVYRFWSDTYNGHFYTMSVEERDHVINAYPDNIWRYEGEAWWVKE
jgi:hypothetical protein